MLHLLLDENSESTWFLNQLRKSGHNVDCVRNLASKGICDLEVLNLAVKHKRVLYTRDRDFFEVQNTNQNHYGIIFEFISGTMQDMSIAQIVESLEIIEENYQSLRGQLVIINNFRSRK